MVGNMTVNKNQNEARSLPVHDSVMAQKGGKESDQS